MAEVSDDLKEIVSSTIDSIREGLKDKNVQIAGAIKFELAVIKEKKGKGGIRFLIADASGEYSKESISRITFEVVGKSVALHGLKWE